MTQSDRTLMDDIPVGLYRTAEDGRFLEANSALVALLGYPSREALLAAPVPSLYVDADARARWVSQLSEKGVVRDFEFRLRRLNGEVIWVRDTTRTVTSAAGAGIYYEGALEDITDWVEAREALKQSEDYFRALIEKSYDIITVVDGEGTVRYESPAIFAVLGYTIEEMVGQNVFAYVHPDDLANIAGQFGAMLAERLPGARAELRFRHKDGSWRLLDATATNLLENPAVRGVVINSRDLTERVALEEKVRQGAKMEAVGRLAGGIAHDFNNLLTAIRVTAELLAEDLVAHPTAMSELQEIRDSADRATALTRQLLAFSRQQILQPRVLNLNTVITGVHGMLERLLGQDIQVATKLDPQLGETMVDATQIEQVILNLAINARDAMPAGGVLDLETRNREITPGERGGPLDASPGSYVQLEVCDTGAGIPPDILPQIFEPFFTTKPTGSGTGLGLATVMGIVQQSGGYISASNRPTGGTSFCVLFPRVDSAPVVPAPPAVAGESAGGSETVLLVEDEPGIRRLTRRILERSGYIVLEAEDGPAALLIAEAQTERIDLLLTDVIMPRMRGPELADRLREKHPDLRVLFMSGFNQEAISRHGTLVAGTSFLQKPFDVHQLAAKVREALDSEVM